MAFRGSNMWPWRQSVQFKYFIFWGQLITLVAGLHIVLLYSFLFVQHGINLADNLTITARFASGDLPVVFMPFYKHVPGSIQQINIQVANNSRKQSLSKPQNIKTKNSSSKPVIYKLSKPPAPKVTKTKLSKNSAKVKLDKLKLVQKSAPKIKSIEVAPETLPAKIKPAEPVLPKSIEKNSSEIVTPVENKKADSQVAKPETSAINKTKLDNNASVTSAVNSSNLNNHSTNTTVSNANNNSELAIGRKDLELLQLQDSLRGAVSQNWRPPLGFKRDLETVIEVFVDPAGIMERVDIKQSSGVLVFDASVELAINQVVWPAEAWGKSHTLTFKQ